MKSNLKAIRGSFDGTKTELVITVPMQFKKLLEGIAPLQELINKGKQLEVIVQQKKKKRSNDANAYAWVLLTAIADKLSANRGHVYTKDDVYLQMLERYGQTATIKIHNAEEEKVLRCYKYVKRCDEDFWNEVPEFAFYKIFVGSSQYNTEEMAIFIAGIVQDAKDLGIETMTPAELAALEV